MKSFITKRIANFLKPSPKPTGNVRFPGLALPHPNVVARVEGSLLYGSEIIIEPYCRFLVPEQALVSLGNRVYLGHSVLLEPSGKIEIGERASIQDRCVIIGDVRIGRYCVFSLNVYISSGRHYYKEIPHLLIRDQDAAVCATPEGAQAHSRPVVIGEDCWLGINTVIMSGVEIGRGAVIGSNSVVTRDVAPYVVMAGAPARQIGTRLDFSPPERISWSREEDIPYFYSGFELAADQRSNNKNLCGHLAKSDFEVWLSKNGKSATLRVRSAGKEVQLRNEENLWSIDQAWTEITVPLENNGRLSFAVEEDEGIVVSDVWVG